MNYRWLACCALFCLHAAEHPAPGRPTPGGPAPGNPIPDSPEKNPIDEEQSDKPVIFQTIVNQQLTLPEENPRHFFGKRLNAYLNSLDTKTFKEFFPKLPLRGRLMYMLTINIIEYELFLDRYSNNEWADYWLDLPKEEQKYIPRTRVEQLCVIRDAYYSYLHRNSYFPSFFNPKSPYPNDLADLKKECYTDDRLATGRDDMHIFAGSKMKAFLQTYMLRKRYELFNL